MKTAEDFMWDYGNLKTNDYGTRFDSIGEEQCKKAMIEFAKMHVKAALKAASEDAEINDYDEHHQYSPSIDSSSILNAYLLDTIK